MLRVVLKEEEGFYITRKRERERERDFLDWDFAPPLSALPHKNETSS